MKWTVRNESSDQTNLRSQYTSSSKMNTIAETSLEVLLFNGKAIIFNYWSPKFVARYCKKKTSSIFLGNPLVPPKSEYDAALLITQASRTDPQRKTMKDFYLNSSDYDELVMSMDDSTDGGKIAFHLVNNSCMAANPSGYAKVSCDSLELKYRPSTAPRYMRSEMTLVNSKLALDDTPDAWMNYVERIVCKMNNCVVTGKSAKTDMDTILNILCHLPKSYKVVVQEVSIKIEENTASCTLKLVCERIMLRYEIERSPQ